MVIQKRLTDMAFPAPGGPQYYHNIQQKATVNIIIVRHSVNQL